MKCLRCGRWLKRYASVSNNRDGGYGPVCALLVGARPQPEKRGANLMTGIGTRMRKNHAHEDQMQLEFAA